jgi:hypothetical protein
VRSLRAEAALERDYATSTTHVSDYFADVTTVRLVGTRKGFPEGRWTIATPLALCFDRSSREGLRAIQILAEGASPTERASANLRVRRLWRHGNALWRIYCAIGNERCLRSMSSRRRQWVFTPRKRSRAHRVAQRGEGKSARSGPNAIGLKPSPKRIVQFLSCKIVGCSRRLRPQTRWSA